MRLLVAALIAAALVTTGAVLFSTWFGSVELRTEGDGEVARKQRADTETETSTERDDSATQSKACAETDTSGYCVFVLPGDDQDEYTCSHEHLENYKAPESVMRVFPGKIFDLRSDLPDMYVDVTFCIDTEGKVESSRASSASGPPLFDGISQRMVSRWKFEPARSKGKPVGVCGCDLKFKYEVYEPNL